MPTASTAARPMLAGVLLRQMTHRMLVLWMLMSMSQTGPTMDPKADREELHPQISIDSPGLRQRNWNGIRDADHGSARQYSSGTVELRTEAQIEAASGARAVFTPY